jgi:hypothetical protein
MQSTSYNGPYKTQNKSLMGVYAFAIENCRKTVNRLMRTKNRQLGSYEEQSNSCYTY